MYLYHVRRVPCPEVQRKRADQYGIYAPGASGKAKRYETLYYMYVQMYACMSVLVCMYV